MTRVIHRNTEPKGPTPPPAPPPTQPELPLEGYSLGDEHPVLGKLQLALGVPVTGVYDEATKRAVQSVQFQHDMDTTGIASPAVFAKLNIAWEK